MSVPHRFLEIAELINSCKCLLWTPLDPRYCSNVLLTGGRRERWVAKELQPLETSSSLYWHCIRQCCCCWEWTLVGCQQDIMIDREWVTALGIMCLFFMPQCFLHWVICVNCVKQKQWEIIEMNKGKEKHFWCYMWWKQILEVKLKWSPSRQELTSSQTNTPENAYHMTVLMHWAGVCGVHRKLRVVVDELFLKISLRGDQPAIKSNFFLWLSELLPYTNFCIKAGQVKVMLGQLEVRELHSSCRSVTALLLHLQKCLLYPFKEEEICWFCSLSFIHSGATSAATDSVVNLSGKPQDDPLIQFEVKCSWCALTHSDSSQHKRWCHTFALPNSHRRVAALWPWLCSPDLLKGVTQTLNESQSSPLKRTLSF